MEGRQKPATGIPTDPRPTASAKTEFTSEKNEHQPYIDDQNHCALCGTKLHFKHELDYHTLRIREDADCLNCGIRIKTREYGLQ